MIMLDYHKYYTAAIAIGPKWWILFWFIFQNSLLIIGLKACNLYSSHLMDQYIPSTAVAVTEIVKLLLSTAACFVIDAKCSFHNFFEIIFVAFVDDGADCMKLCLPAILYTIQNNLQYVIEEAPLFLVLYQAKIITTAAFCSMLNRRLSRKEWLAAGVLALGVGMVESSQYEIVPHTASNTAGVISVVFACLTSGFAGVYFEKILKQTRSTIWVMNIQMSLLSCFFCTLVSLTSDTEDILNHGLWSGYNPLVVLIIILQAFTGLTVALVVKYADNINKSYAQAISILGCSVASSFFFDDTTINETFLLGGFLVMLACVAFFNIVRKAHHPVASTDTIAAGNESSNGSSGSFNKAASSADAAVIDDHRNHRLKHIPQHDSIDGGSGSYRNSRWLRASLLAQQSIDDDDEYRMKFSYDSRSPTMTFSSRSANDGKNECADTVDGNKYSETHDIENVIRNDETEIKETSHIDDQEETGT